MLAVSWTYGELFTDLTHSRMLHWQVLAIGKKGPARGFSLDVSPSPVPRGSAHTADLMVMGDLLCR